MARAAALALLAAILIAPEAARAGCLHPVAPTPGDVAHFDRLARAGALDQPEPTGAPEPPRRCPGGMCSQGDRDPLVPTSAPWRIAPQDVLMTAGLRLAAPGTDILPIDGALLHPADLAPAIFHPPRPAR